MLTDSCFESRVFFKCENEVVVFPILAFTSALDLLLVINDASQERERVHLSQSFSIKFDWFGALRVVVED